MPKKDYLTREEYQLWKYIKDLEIIDSEVIQDIFPEILPKKKNKILAAFAKKGYLIRVRKDIYYNPQKIKSFYKLALRIKEGYLGLGSALRMHHLLEYEDFTITVVTRTFREKIPLRGTNYEIQFIPLKKVYTGFIKKEDVIVSTVEKTIFDCLLKPQQIGFTNITKAIYTAKINWKLFLEFFKQVDNNALCQRTGYILEMMKKNIKYPVPAFVLEYLVKRAKNPVKLLPMRGTSVFDKKWKIQDNVGKKIILSWWS